MLFISNPAAFLSCKYIAFGNLKCFDVAILCFEVVIFLKMKDDFNILVLLHIEIQSQLNINLPSMLLFYFIGFKTLHIS